MAHYQFPKDMKLDSQPYMIFRAFKWSMRGRKTQDIHSVQKGEDTIVLPISTNGVVDSISNNWEEGVGIADVGLKDVFFRNLVSKVADSIGDLGKYISARRGFLVNDYAGLAFSGTSFRTFEFSFTLIPKNSDEATTILNLVKAFKRNSLPEYQEWKILYPNYWNIFIRFPGDREVVKLKNCVMTTFTSNIFDDGVPTIFSDGTPQKTTLSLGFTELQKLDRRDYA